MVELGEGCTTQVHQSNQEQILVERSKEKLQQIPENPPTKQDTGEMGSQPNHHQNMGGDRDVNLQKNLMGGAPIHHQEKHDDEMVLKEEKESPSQDLYQHNVGGAGPDRVEHPKLYHPQPNNHPESTKEWEKPHKRETKENLGSTANGKTSLKPYTYPRIKPLNNYPQTNQRQKSIP